MDTRLLKHYEGELAFLRDMGGEFAEAYPKIASRLLEGVAFLSARVQLELEMQFPALTSHLLEIVYPHYLAPTPSMMVAAFEPDMQNAALADGYVVPRNTVLRSKLADDDKTPCTFRTAHPVTMWPSISTAAAR